MGRFQNSYFLQWMVSDWVCFEKANWLDCYFSIFTGSQSLVSLMLVYKNTHFQLEQYKRRCVRIIWLHVHCLVSNLYFDMPNGVPIFSDGRMMEQSTFIEWLIPNWLLPKINNSKLPYFYTYIRLFCNLVYVCCKDIQRSYKFVFS